MRNRRNKLAAIFFRRYECLFQGPVPSDRRRRAGKRMSGREEERVEEEVEEVEEERGGEKGRGGRGGKGRE